MQSTDDLLCKCSAGSMPRWAEWARMDGGHCCAMLDTNRLHIVKSWFCVLNSFWALTTRAIHLAFTSRCQFNYQHHPSTMQLSIAIVAIAVASLSVASYLREFHECIIYCRRESLLCCAAAPTDGLHCQGNELFGCRRKVTCGTPTPLARFVCARSWSRRHGSQDPV